MKYAGLVARREYLETIKTRGFWVGVFMFPLILFLMMSVPVWLAQKATPVRYYVLVDQSGSLAPVVDSGMEKYYQRKVLDALNEYARKNSTPATNGPNSLAQFNAGDPQSLDKFTALGGQDYFLKELQPRLKSNAPPFAAPTRMYQPVPLPAELKADADLPALARDLRPYLRGEKKLDFEGRAQSLTAAILIPSNIEQRIVRPHTNSAAGSAGTNGIEYWSANVTDSDLRDQVSQAVNNEVRRKEFLARGMDAAAFHDVERTYAPLISLNPKKEAGKETVNSGDVVQQWLPSAFVYLLWVALFGISQMLLSNTIEEKSNRIIEVLLSSVTPGELMMGKLFGIAGGGPDDDWRVGALAVFRIEREGRGRLGNRRADSADFEDVPSAAVVLAVFPAGLFDVWRAHPVHRQRLQHPQGGAELHEHAHIDHDGAADDDDLYSQGPERHAGAGAFVDPAVHAVHHDEPHNGGPAVD